MNTSGFKDEDQFFLAFDDGHDTGIFRVADTTKGDGWNPDTIELLVVLQDFTAPFLDQPLFANFLHVPPPEPL